MVEERVDEVNLNNFFRRGRGWNLKDREVL